jgi:hypothetical protein
MARSAMIHQAQFFERMATRDPGSQFCSTWYRNPDTGLCVSPAEVHWIQGTGLPNASTVGRNTLVAGGINNFDVTLTKSLQIGERRRLEFRWEAFNITNTPWFGNPNGISFSNASQLVSNGSRDGEIRSIQGAMRKMQFALKYMF